MKIKVITFDFWNTLFDSSNGQIRNNERIAAIAEELSKLGIAADIELNPLLSKAMEYFNSEWINKQTTPDALQLIEFIWAELKIKKDLFAMGRLKTVFEEAVLYYPPALTDGVREALNELEQYYKLAIVSDTGFSPGRILKSLLNTEDILHYFSAFSFSNETKTAKPNIYAFEYALQPLGCSPEEAIHIGDIERTDIVGAKSIGMKAIRYSGDSKSNNYNENDLNSIADFCSDNWGDIVTWISHYAK